MFNCSLHTNQLEIVLRTIQLKIKEQKQRISELETNLKLKTADKALSLHIERLTTAVPKDVGEKSSKFRLND